MFNVVVSLYSNVFFVNFILCVNAVVFAFCRKKGDCAIFHSPCSSAFTSNSIVSASGFDVKLVPATIANPRGIVKDCIIVWFSLSQSK